MKTLLTIAIATIAAFAHADDRAEIGRYQLLYAVTEHAAPETTTGPSTITIKTVWKIDTVTGQVWQFVSTVGSNKELKEAFLPIDTRAP
jgi:hypothetical protein